MYDQAALHVGRLARVAARIRKPGGGSAIPGVVVNRIAPGVLAHAFSSFPLGLQVVSGSSGKSTTTKMLVEILRAHDESVFTNPSTANIAQGLTSAIVEQADAFGRLPGERAVLEMDEGHGAKLIPSLSPSLAVLLNVGVDQVDRFPDHELVTGYLQTIGQRATEHVVLNADDAELERIAPTMRAAVSRFGVASSIREAGWPRLGLVRLVPIAERAPLDAEVVAYEDRSATLRVLEDRADIALPAAGLHYAVDAAAAALAAARLLGPAFSLQTAAGALSSMPPVFGRGQRVTVRGHEVDFMLVQNAASLDLNAAQLRPGTEQILFALGSDVRDAAYLWPAKLRCLDSVTIVSGLKAYHAALLLAYDDVKIGRVEPDLHRALDEFLALPAPSRGVKTVLFSADSMRKTRQYLGLSGPES